MNSLAPWFRPDLLIYFSLCLKTVGFMVRDELILRILVATGMMCDALFYILQVPPIYPPILASSFLIIVNLVIVGVIVTERTTIAMGAREKALFATFETLSPGQFRRLMRLARLVETEAEEVLTVEGEAPAALWFVETDRIGIVKAGQRSRARGPAFVGEVAFLKGGVASAGVSVPAGSRYVRWDAAPLAALLARKPALRNALTSRIARDMAAKVAGSMPMETAGV